MAKPAFKFELHGMKELMDALSELPTMSMKKGVVRNALKKAALPVKEAAQANAQSLPMRAAKLAESIKVGTSLKKSQRGRQDRSRVTVYVGSSHPLAHLFEFGTAERFTTGKKSVKAGVSRGYIPPMPFLRQAWDSNKKIALGRIGEELWKALQKSAKMLAKKSAKGTLTKGQRAGLMK